MTEYKLAQLKYPQVSRDLVNSIWPLVLL